MSNNWTAPTDFGTVCRRAAGRRRYNAARKPEALAADTDHSTRAVGGPRVVRDPGTLARELGISRATICRDFKAIRNAHLGATGNKGAGGPPSETPTPMTVYLPVPVPVAGGALDVTPARPPGRLPGRPSPSTLIAYQRDLDDFATFTGAGSADAAAAPLGPRTRIGERAGTPLQGDLQARGLAAATVNRRLAALRSLVKLARMLALVGWARGGRVTGAGIPRDGRARRGRLPAVAGPPRRPR